MNPEVFRGFTSFVNAKGAFKLLTLTTKPSRTARTRSRQMTSGKMISFIRDSSDVPWWHVAMRAKLDKLR